MALKDTWKDVGKGLGFAFRDLGKAVIKSARTGVEIVDEWANSENPKAENQDAEGETAEITDGEVAETSETTEADVTVAEAETDAETTTEEPVPEPVVIEKPRFTHDNIDDNDD